jgi:hypothetical protein
MSDERKKGSEERFGLLLVLLLLPNQGSNLNQPELERESADSESDHSA